MKEFIVRLFSLLAIVGVLFGYNEVLNVRAKDEEITKLNAQLEAQTSAVFSASESGSDSVLIKTEHIPEKRMDLVERLR